MFNQTEIDSLRSLNDSELLTVLQGMKPDEQHATLLQLRAPQFQETRERKNFLERMRATRSQGAAIVIPEIVNPARRESCLADPEKFLLTYGAPEQGKPVELQDGKFWMPFASHHLAMIDAIYQRAKTGGDKAVAAPRGDGKSTVVFWMLLYIVLAELRHHPAGFGQTDAKAKEKLFNPIKKEFTRNPLLYEDFPEICHPLKDLDDTPQRGLKQHIDGVKTDVICSADHIRLAVVPAGPYNDESPYGGCTFDYYGFGTAKRGSRHDFAAIDDPETEAVAKNEELNRDLEKQIDSAVAGMAFPTRTLPRVVITTIQNRHCYSYRVTSRDVDEGGKPTFEGDRYGILSKWPDCWDNEDLDNLWEDYISMRHADQAAGDKDGKNAVQFYLDNREAMEAGAVVSNPERYDQQNKYEVSALQAFFNRIADWGLDRVMCELQNDPPPEEVEESLGLKPGKVASRISGLSRNQLPDVHGLVTCGLDIGKRYSHWVKVFWHGNAIGNVIDYGRHETPILANQDLHLSLLKGLNDWRTIMLANNRPDMALIDSGAYTASVYEFVRQNPGGVFNAAAGVSRWAGVGESVKGKRMALYEAFAKWNANEKVWLFNHNSEFWKNWLQERFITDTFDDQQQFNDGSLSLFAGKTKEHLVFSEHICAEGLESLFVPPKGIQVKWKVFRKQNHWLDALALACVGAAVKGVRLVQKHQVQSSRPKVKGSRYKKRVRGYPQRQGGWVQGVKR